jgi:predicted DNA-binding protein YlxM (UPF0122 family)
VKRDIRIPVFSRRNWYSTSQYRDSELIETLESENKTLKSQLYEVRTLLSKFSNTNANLLSGNDAVNFHEHIKLFRETRIKSINTSIQICEDNLKLINQNIGRYENDLWVWHEKKRFWESILDKIKRDLDDPLSDEAMYSYIKK